MALALVSVGAMRVLGSNLSRRKVTFDLVRRAPGEPLRSLQSIHWRSDAWN